VGPRRVDCRRLLWQFRLDWGLLHFRLQSDWLGGMRLGWEPSRVLKVEKIGCGRCLSLTNCLWTDGIRDHVLVGPTPKSGHRSDLSFSLQSQLSPYFSLQKILNLYLLIFPVRH